MRQWHGHARDGAETPTYISWKNMLRRCESPGHKTYHLYGGRGIVVCPRWHSFPNFLADMGTRPDKTMLERVDTNGSYEPGNCVWATGKQQARNRRSNCLVTIGEKTQPITAWAEEAGINWSTLHSRIFKLGWLPERAFITPVRRVNV